MFRDDKWVCSNFYPLRTPIIDRFGIRYPTVEHAYVASKTDDVATRRRVATLATPGQAKRFGRTSPVRPDWEQVKVGMMRKLLDMKFSDPALLAMLRAIPGDLVEENAWHDNFWGVCVCGRCVGGQNHLGILLTDIKEGR